MHLLRVLSRTRLNTIGHIRCLCDGPKKGPDDPLHPIYRTGRLLGNDMKKVKNFFFPEKKIISSDVDIRDLPSQPSVDEFHSHCDILVIGGGGVGSSIAYWLKKRGRHGINVVVLEKDPTVSRMN